MKRIISVLLLISMLFLFSCTEATTNTNDTTAADTTEKVKIDVQVFEYEIDPENHTEDQLGYINARSGQIAKFAVGDTEKSQPNPYVLNFESEVSEGADSYVIEIAENKDFENSYLVEGLDKPEYDFYNPKSGADVYFRGAQSTEDLDNVNIYHFTVTDVLPRMIRIDGVSNVRDIGGYATTLVEGATINQGLYYRGGNLDDITEEGKKEMLDHLGIRCELDLREVGTAKGPGVEGFEYHDTSIALEALGSDIFEEWSDQYYEIFTCISEADEKPVYLHCTAGADRTGIASYMLLTLLGVEFNDSARDYLFTNFGVFGARSLTDGPTIYSKKLDEQYDGADQAERAKQWLMSKGVEEEKIEKIRSIFIDGYGE